MKTAFFKKGLSALMCAVMLITCMISVGVPVSAVEYPIIALNRDLTALQYYVGDTANIVFDYFPVYADEIVCVDFYDANGTLVATAEKQFYHTYEYVEYTVEWDTTDYVAGTYDVRVQTKYYSNGQWNVTPRNSHYNITLIGGSGGYTGWGSENGLSVYYKNGVKATNQWVSDGRYWYYLGSDGYLVANCWQKDSKGWCYLDASGRMKTNSWVRDSVGWCYVGADGYAVTNCWKRDSIGWCYLDANGRMKTNAWVKDSVGWCYVGSNGYAVTNCWKRDSYGWCYLDQNGRMKTNAWVRDSVGWCYVGSNGYAVTNSWKRDSYGWCYLDENGRMLKNSWLKDGSTWYFLDPDGYMATGTWIIDGVTYTFNSSGVLVG